MERDGRHFHEELQQETSLNLQLARRGCSRNPIAVPLWGDRRMNQNHSPMHLRSLLEQWSRSHGHPIAFHGDSIDAVIIGEFHGDMEMGAEQLELARILQPHIYLHELMRNYMFEPSRLLLRENAGYQMSALAQEFARMEYPCPIPAPPEEFTEEFREWLGKHAIRNELHPYEALYLSVDFWTAGSHVQMLQQEAKLGFLLAGCDYSFAEIHHYEAEHDIREGEGLGSVSCPREHHQWREASFAAVIGHYAKRAKKPPVVTLGLRHTDEESAIHAALEGKSVGYACIAQQREIADSTQVHSPTQKPT